MLYQLLLNGLMPWKQKKMVVTGPPDSGKSSWLEPILAVLDRRHLATCTNESKFSCQMINDDTQLIWLDEWEAGKTYRIYLQITGVCHWTSFSISFGFNFRFEKGGRIQTAVPRWRPIFRCEIWDCYSSRIQIGHLCDV